MAKRKKAYSGIGGQAVLEGIMMKNREKVAVAVRRPDGQIEVDLRTYDGVARGVFRKVPFVRGIFSLLDSLVLGTGCLNFSAEIYAGGEEEEEEEPGFFEKLFTKLFGERAEKVMMGLITAVSFILAIGIFMLLPWLVVELLRPHLHSESLLAIIEGVLRLVIFLGYVVMISLMKDIRRVFMYHGAEHKCINCVEKGYELNVENVMHASRQHKRCGTSFLLFVMLVSIILFFFIRMESPWLRLLVRILLIPVIAGISYEIIRLAGKTDFFLVQLLSVPGLLLQRLTTKEPTEDMAEVAIKAVDAVFDWRAFLKENFDMDVPREAPAEQTAEKAVEKSPAEAVTAEAAERSPEFGTAETAEMSPELMAAEAAGSGAEEFAQAPGMETGLSGGEAEAEELRLEIPDSYSQAYLMGRELLESAGVPEAELDARLLLEAVCNTSLGELQANPDRPLSAEEKQAYEACLISRARRIPLQLILGSQDFMGLPFLVEEGVLIPRQDTEILVEEALKELHDGMKILDVCTGSGCILLSLLHFSNGCYGMGTDISGQALMLASRNAANLGLEADFVQTDLTAGIEEQFDLVVSNPPYIPSDVIPTLEPEVKDHEPLNALDGGIDGLDYYRRLCAEAYGRLVPGGRVFLEIGSEQASAVKELLELAGFVDVETARDYSGLDRVITGRKAIR